MGNDRTDGAGMIDFHYPLAASSASMWSLCAGSVRMQQAYPQQKSPKSKEGVCAHWVLSELLSGRTHAAGTFAPNGVEITEEMIDGAELCADHVNALRTAGDVIHIEERLHAPHIHEHNGGTPDVILWQAAQRTLHVFDYKFGHRYVEVFENKQLINYASAFLMEDAEDVTIFLHIVQPRSFCADGPIRRWKTDSSELDVYAEALATAAAAAMAPEAVRIPNPECGDCSARHACVALQQTALTVVDLAYDAVPFDLSDPMAGHELRYLTQAAERLDARISGLTADIESRMRGGRVIPFWTMTPSAPREQWTKPVEEVLAMGELFGQHLQKPAAPITPAQARKVGVPDEILAAYSARPAGTMKLAPVSGIQARKTFTQGA